MRLGMHNNMRADRRRRVEVLQAWARNQPLGELVSARDQAIRLGHVNGIPRSVSELIYKTELNSRILQNVNRASGSNKREVRGTP